LRLTAEHLSAPHLSGVYGRSIRAHDLAKVGVEGSNPFARSSLFAKSKDWRDDYSTVAFAWLQSCHPATTGLVRNFKSFLIAQSLNQIEKAYGPCLRTQTQPAQDLVACRTQQRSPWSSS